jgi:ABC-type microcin C transport system permease subunit YejE
MIMVLATPITARYGINEQIKIENGNNVFSRPRTSPGSAPTTSTRRNTRLLYGIRTSMFIGLVGDLSVLIGTVVGAFAGLRGGG